MRERLVLLGTGTCQLQTDRRASSVLIELDGLRVVYDMGRGIADRLAELGLRQDDIQHIVLSHFHPDHLSDLIPYLQAASWSRMDPRSLDLHIYGPPGLEVQLMRLLSLFDPGVLVRETFRVHLHEIRAEALEIQGYRWTFEDLPPAGNRGLKFERRQRVYALTGDSSFHEQEVEFLRGVDTAVIDSGHLDEDEIVALAARSNAGRIICSHVYQELDAAALQRRAEDRGFRGTLEMGQDLMEVLL